MTLSRTHHSPIVPLLHLRGVQTPLLPLPQPHFSASLFIVSAELASAELSVGLFRFVLGFTVSVGLVEGLLLDACMWREQAHTALMPGAYGGHNRH